MKEITIDKEFQDLLPPLDRKTYEALEENIIANGCMYPLVTWQDPLNEALSILIDGHNRYNICTEHDIDFKTVEKEFASREDVVIWIISNQVARRNLTPLQLTYFRGLHYNTVKLKKGSPPGNTRAQKQKSKNDTSVFEPDSAKKLSDEYKVSRNTIFNDAKASVAIDSIGKQSPEAKSKILTGDVVIDKKILQKLATASEDEIKTVAIQIEDGTFDKSTFGNNETATNLESIQEGSLNRGIISGHIDGTASNSNTAIFNNELSSFLAQLDIEHSNPVISAITGQQWRTLIKTASNGTNAQTKRALQTYIKQLEMIYGSL